MDQSTTPAKTPTSDPDGKNVLFTPRAACKRPTPHVDTPDLDHQAKKSKMEDHPRQGEHSAHQVNASMVRRPRLEDAVLGHRPEENGVSSLLPHQDLNPLVIRYEEDLADMKAQMADLKASMQSLEAQIPIKDKQLQGLKEYIAIQHIQPIAADIQGPDDSAVTSIFEVLRFAIENLTQDHLNGPPFSKPTKIDHKNLFARLTKTEDDYKEYLGNGGLKAFFFEGVIWTKLIDRLLRSPLSAFLDVKESVIRDHVYDQGGASPQRFHAWRAYTADFLEDALGSKNPWRPRSELRSYLVEELVELLSKYSTSGAGNVLALTQQLDVVVDKAVNLAWLMAKSKAYWVCNLPTSPMSKLPHGFIYKKEIMKVAHYLEGGQRNIVDLVGRPSMLKYGNSNGEQYETHVVVDKAVCLAYEGKEPKRADPTYVDS